jgi:membrane protein DedA with SNARE-associated domain
MLHSFIDTLLSYFGSLSYGDIFFLMTLESSIVPVPSELVMIPAGWAAASGSLDPFIATIVG